MIIEGDVTGKQLPYYKGIRSSFDNTDKVEVLSNGKNLFNLLNGNLTYNGIDKVRDVVITEDTIKVSNNVNGAWQNLGCIVNVKPNTKYSFSVSNRTKTDNGYNLVTIYHGSKSIMSMGSNLDTKSITFTTPSDCNEITIRFYCSSENTITGCTSTYTNPQLQESPTATPYQPHKENSTIINMPMQLETVEVVKVDRVKDMEIGAINHGTGANNDSSTSLRTKNYIPVQPSMHITYCNNGVERATHFIYYDINKNFIGARVYESGVTSKGTVTTPDNCYFIRLYHAVTNVDNLTITKQQYKPIALNELPNGVKDELIINRATSSAKLIQRVGKIVLDGSEDWGYTPNWVKGETIGFYLLNDKSNGFCLSDKFAFYHGINSVDHECVSFPKNAWLGVRIKVDKLGTQDVNGFKQYLQQNPLTVYYELA